MNRQTLENKLEALIKCMKITIHDRNLFVAQYNKLNLYHAIKYGKEYVPK